MSLPYERQVGVPVAASVAFLIAFALLQLEIALTRIVSYIAWHFFTFVIISVALLGLGAAASFVTVRIEREPHWPDIRQMTSWVQWSAVSLPLSLLILCLLPLDPMRLRDVPLQSLWLLIAETVLGLPFFFAGIVLTSIITREARQIHIIYCADLVGGSAGCVAALALLPLFGALYTALFSACILAAAGALLQFHSRRSIGSALLLPGLILLGLAGGLYFDPIKLHVPPSKEMSRFENGSRSLIDVTRWTPITRIDVLTPIISRIPSLGGDISSRFSRKEAEMRLLFQDGTAFTAFLKSDGKFQNMPFLGGYLQAVPYVISQQPSVLVIGVGGGPDLMIALYHGAREVTGVEVNPATVDLLSRTFRDYVGQLAARPEVHLINAEGRNYLARDEHQYDIIQLSGVDTYSALAAGASALSEGYLYTVEAVRDAWARLAPNGILSYSRWNNSPPREALRLNVLMRTALNQSGVDDAAAHVMIVGGERWADTMLRRSPFTKEDVERVQAWCARNDFVIIYDPFKNRQTVFDLVWRGQPSQVEGLVRDYPYAVSATTDDQPFFFNYCRLFSPSGTYGFDTDPLPAPIFTLLICLGEVSLLALVGIVVPLTRLEKGQSRRGALSVLVYFAALGLGYMFVEVPMMQSFLLFLGSPGLALTFVVATMMLCSGLGSLFSQKLVNRLDASRFAMLGLLIAGALMCFRFALSQELHGMVGLGFGWRLGVCALSLGPLAFVLGLPMPVGIRALGETTPWLTPWAWGINAFVSVLAPVVAALLSMFTGFSALLSTAALVYLAGFFAFIPWVRFARGGPSMR